LILPANIKEAIDHVDYQNATFEGKGLSYLWFRIPLQLLFIAWTYFSCIATWALGGKRILWKAISSGSREEEKLHRRPL
jgi:hypothetical protein